MGKNKFFAASKLFDLSKAFYTMYLTKHPVNKTREYRVFSCSGSELAHT